MQYQIVHSTSGRCRVRVPRLARDARLIELLEQQVRSLPFVTEVRINASACSLVVGYRPKAVAAGNATPAIELAEEKLCSCIQQAIGILRNEKKKLDGIDGTEDEEEDLIPLENQWKDLGMPVLSLGVALLAAPLELPALVVGTAIAGAAMPWFVRAGDSIKTQGHANIDLLDSLWMTIQALRGQYVAPALKTVLVEVRRSLRGTVSDDRETTASNLLQSLNAAASLQVERDGQVQTLSLEQVQIGDRLLIQVGQTIPVDGFVVQGTGLLDYEALTGTPTPVACGVTQEVYALAVLREGELWLQVTRIGMNTRMGLVAQLMDSIPVHDTHIGAAQAEFVRQSIIPTILLGGAVFAATGNIGAAISPYQFDFGSGVPITISTTLLTALTHAARYGIYIRSGRALELLAKLDVVVFDQTALVSNSHRNRSVSADRIAAVDALHRQGMMTYLLAGTAETGKAEAHLSDASLSDAAFRPADSIAIARQCQIPADHILHDETQQAHLIHGLRHHQKIVAVVGEMSGATAHHTCADLTVAIVPQGDVTQVDADVVLTTPTLQSLNDAIAIARRAMEVLYQNTALITVPNLFMQIGGGMVLGVSPVYNVIINNSSALIAEFINGNHPHFDTVAPVSRSLFHKIYDPTLLNHTLPSSPLAPFDGTACAEAIDIKAIPIELNGVDHTHHAAKNGANHEGNHEGNHEVGKTANRTVNRAVNKTIWQNAREEMPAQLPQAIGLKQKELAKRLGVTTQALTYHRSQSNFAAWSRDRDPEGKAWTFVAQTRCFY